jgi:hypothetical protein
MKSSRLTYLCLLAWVLFFSSAALLAQETEVYPSHWWTGMKWNQVQLLVHSKNINAAQPKVVFNYPGVTVKKVTRTESPNYIVGYQRGTCCQTGHYQYEH